MKPLAFKEQNYVYAKDQPEYLPLPVYKTEDGTVWSCWGLTWKERIKLAFTGKFWFGVMTFNHPLQPQRPMIDSPFKGQPEGAAGSDYADLALEEIAAIDAKKKEAT